MKLLEKKILLVTAHPDDESYAAAGTLYKNHQAGGINMLICATLGEKGKAHMKRPVTDAQMKKIRRRELQAAANYLHVSPVIVLNIPDTAIVRWQADVFRKALSYVKKLHPEIILSYGIDGISGHVDHVTIGRVARQIAKKMKIPFVTFALPPRLTRHALPWLQARRRLGHYAATIRFTKPNIRIQVDSNVKKKALRLYKSQMDGQRAFTGFPGFAVKELLLNEYFII
jgi:N-acetylglucosamine malate deacetylase 2